MKDVNWPLDHEGSMASSLEDIEASRQAGQEKVTWQYNSISGLPGNKDPGPTEPHPADLSVNKI